jgi:hypothetical protein
MNTAWNGRVEAVGDLEVGLEAVDLAAVGVAAHGHIDRAEAALVLATVEHVGGEQDHARAGAEHRHARREPRAQRYVEQARRAVEQLRHGGGLAAGHDPSIRAGHRRTEAHG